MEPLDIVAGAARDDARLSVNYLILIVASCIIASIGLLENSVAVIIGAMIVAPLIGPIQAFAYASVAGERLVLRSAIWSAAAGIALAVLISGVLGLVLAVPVTGSEIVARTRPTLLDLAIAVTAGGVAGFARVRPAIAATVAGTAIAVALMPPLCVVGLMLSQGRWSAAEGAALLFGTNFFGIALACMTVFAAFGRVRAHSYPALLTTIAVTLALTLPLGASFAEIVREGHIEAAVREQLQTGTVTFRNARLGTARFDWYASPVTAVLSVSAPQPVTPAQVRDLEAFVRRRAGLPIRLVIDVSRYTRVTDEATTSVDAADEPG